MRLLFDEGVDVTEVLGITKWERPDAEDYGNKGEPKKKTRQYPKWLMRFAWFRQLVYRLEGRRTSNAFPSFVSKTDEVRIQNCPWMLDDRNKEWVVTEKIDGTSGTFAVKKGKKRWGRQTYEYYVCSRNRRIFGDDGSIYVAVFKKYNMERALRELIEHLGCDWVCIQGECIGPGVQGNKYKLKEPAFYAFNFITSDIGRWASGNGKGYLDVEDIPWVPMYDPCILPGTVEEMLLLAHGTSQINPDILREGVVCRSLDGKQSFKAVDPEFLIHWGE